jgi:hypothetical protein
MTVNDCIKEYKNMGSRVFGHPRLPLGPVLTPWHKFNAGDLEKVIHDVTRHHSETADEIEGGVQYPSHEDLCKT